jgi:hypothetical protein
MDPNQALLNARAAIQAMDAASQAEADAEADGKEEAFLQANEDYHDAAAELRDAFEALDEWKAKGGFDPTAWTLTPAGTVRAAKA